MQIEFFDFKLGEPDESDPLGCNVIKTIKNRWEQFIDTKKSLYTNFDFRYCFAKNYNRKNRFVITKNDFGDITGLIPMSYCEEHDSYFYFPGDVLYIRKNWLEDNTLYFKNEETLEFMLDNIKETFDLFYLDSVQSEHRIPDEEQFYLDTKALDYDFSNYIKRFSTKSWKNITKEISTFSNVNIEHNVNFDIDKLFEFNEISYGTNSMYYDTRFRNSILDVIEWAKNNNYLDVVTVKINNDLAAIDLCIKYNNQLYAICGGTNIEYKGVAKIINLHHIQRCCGEKLDAVNFCTGDFGKWKSRFHLDKKMLYKITSDVYKK